MFRGGHTASHQINAMLISVNQASDSRESRVNLRGGPRLVSRIGRREGRQGDSRTPGSHSPLIPMPSTHCCVRVIVKTLVRGTTGRWGLWPTGDPRDGNPQASRPFGRKSLAFLPARARLIRSSQSGRATSRARRQDFAADGLIHHGREPAMSQCHRSEAGFRPGGTTIHSLIAGHRRKSDIGACRRKRSHPT